MSEPITKQWENLGELDTNSNRVTRDSKGARELLGVGDLSSDGHVELLPGYSKILDAPMLADYTTGTVNVSNGSKSVTGNSTAWIYGAGTNLVATPDFSSSTDWTVTAGWVIGSGVATRTAGGTPFTLTEASAVVSGSRYIITYSINRTSGSGTLTATCGGYSRALTAGGAQSISYTFTASSTAAIVFTADSSWAGTVDNVTLSVAAQTVFRGDLFVGPDGEYYEVADITADGALSLTTAYAGTTVSTAAYTIRHKVWMLAPFKNQVPNNSASRSQSYVSTLSGTFTGTASNNIGVYVDPTSFACLVSTGAYGEANVNATLLRRATSFVPSATLTDVIGVDIDVWGAAAGATYSVNIYANSAGKPTGSPLYTTGTIDADTQVAKTDESRTHQTFTSPATLNAGTTYHISVNRVAGSINYSTCAPASTVSAGLTTYGTVNHYVSSWQASAEDDTSFAFIQYPTANKTYVAPVIDIGSTPVSASLTIGAYTPSNLYFFITKQCATEVNFASGDANTLVWELNTSASADMSTPTQVATGQTALTYNITGAANLKRYYQITYTLASATGESTLVVSSASILAVTSLTAPTDLNLSEIVGCGPNVYTSIAASAGSINSTLQTHTRPASWCTYNNSFFYRNGATLLRYWNGISAADATVASMLLTDSVTAGDDPPQRAHIVLSHNDKLITGGYLGIQYFSAANTGITETALTGTGYTANLMVGWKVQPDISWVPEQWFVVTSNTTTVATCAGSELVTDGHAELGDTYSIMKFYPKQAWYSTEAEPADWPTANFLNFNTADGDMVQQMISHGGNLLIICNEQVWLIRGYGPSTPWSKTLLCKSGGTIAPMSVVATAYDVYWWSEEGIVRCANGTSIPEVMDTGIRDFTIGAINSEMRHNIVGTLHQGRVYWSFPSATSNINDTTIVFDPSTRMWAKYDFGMYVPVSILETTGDTYLKFWEPTSGCICKVDPSVYTYGSAENEFVYTTSFMAISNPVEMAQFKYLRAVVKAGETFTGTVSAAYDYGDTYVNVGTLAPVDSTVFNGVNTRTSLNATDTLYACAFAEVVRGASISIKITGATSAALKIMQLEIVADPVEYATLR